MRRSRSASGGGGTEGPAPDPGPVAVAPKVSLRASRPTDGKHLDRIRRLINFALHHGEIVEFRFPEHLEAALVERRAILAVREGTVVGFGAAFPWQEGRFVSHTHVLVDPEFRERDLDSQIKLRLIKLTRRRWPEAAVLGLTLTPKTEYLEQSLGVEPVPYCDLTTDLAFWDGCRSCDHYGHLKRNQYQDCHCWAGLLRPLGSKPHRVIPKDALSRPRPDLRYRAGG